MTKTNFAWITQALSRPPRHPWRALLVTGATVLTGILSTSAAGQVVNPTPEALGTRPIISPQDSNGVDLVTGKAEIGIPLLSFGEHATDLSIALTLSSPLEGGGASAKVAMGQLFGSHTLAWNGGGFISHEIGNVGVTSGPGGSGMLQTHPYYAVTNPDGSKYNPGIGPGKAMNFSNGGSRDGSYDGGGVKLTYSTTLWGVPPIKAEFADGEVWEKFYQQIFVNGNPVSRLKFATSNKGYALQFNYDTDSITDTWPAPTRILSYNKSAIYCEESSLVSCVDQNTAISYVDFVYDEASGSVAFVQKGDTHGRRIFFKKVGAETLTKIIKVDHSGYPGSDVSYGLAVASEEGDDPYYTEYVSSVTRSGATWGYNYWRIMHEGRLYAESFLTRTGPENETISAHGNLVFGVVDEFTDELGRVSVQGLDLGFSRYRIVGQGLPEGNGVAYEYDLRGNITKVTSVAKAGSGLLNIVETSTYPADCENPKVCNRPLSVTDGRGNTTSYTYHPQSGMVASRTSPAVNGIAPVQRYVYEQRYAWIKNSAGGYSPAASPVWLLSEERTCRTTSTVGNACSGGAADEVVTTYDYGPNSGPNTLLLRGSVVTADGISLRTCFGYDAAGRRIWETTPRAGLASCA